MQKTHVSGAPTLLPASGCGTGIDLQKSEVSDSTDWNFLKAHIFWRVAMEDSSSVTIIWVKRN